MLVSIVSFPLTSCFHYSLELVHAVQWAYVLLTMPCYIDKFIPSTHKIPPMQTEYKGTRHKSYYNKLKNVPFSLTLSHTNHSNLDCPILVAIVTR